MQRPVLTVNLGYCLTLPVDEEKLTADVWRLNFFIFYYQ
jgi:hypothetical protein